jgi:hypothetical protein
VDHNRLLPEQLVATATLDSDHSPPRQRPHHLRLHRPAAQVTAAMAGVAVLPLPYRSIPGTINNVGASVRARGVTDGITVTQFGDPGHRSHRHPASFTVTVNPTSIVEGATAQPFYLNFIYDADIGDDTFTLAVELVNTNQASLLTINPATPLTDNTAGLQADIRNISVQATAGALTSLTEVVALRFLLTDGYGGTAATTNLLTLTQSQSPPQITGVPRADGQQDLHRPRLHPLPDGLRAGPQPGRAAAGARGHLAVRPHARHAVHHHLALMTPAQLSLALQASPTRRRPARARWA